MCGFVRPVGQFLMVNNGVSYDKWCKKNIIKVFIQTEVSVLVCYFISGLCNNGMCLFL